MPEDRPVFTSVPQCMDVDFLNSADIPVPQGCTGKWTEQMRASHVMQCRRSIYGLRRSPRLWQDHLSSFLEKAGFVAIPDDPCILRRGGVTLCLYVDDILACSKSHTEVRAFIDELTAEFKCRDYGSAQSFLGCNIRRRADTITISQEDYITAMVERYLDNSDVDVKTPITEPLEPRQPGEERADSGGYRSIVGALLYASCSTRPDIGYSVAQLTRQLHDPTPQHMMAARRVLSYLRSTATRGLTYRADGPSELIGYSDASWAAEPGRKSTSGYVFMLRGAAVSWSSKQQSTIALSSAESEYVALCWAGREAR